MLLEDRFPRIPTRSALAPSQPEHHWEIGHPLA